MKWVEFSQEIDVEIDGRDVALSFQEAWGVIDDDNVPKRDAIIRAIARVGTFLNALTDEQIADLNIKQRETVRKFLESAVIRWKEKL
ncbi:MAG: hypothetical protein A2W35_06535 [Chloroflexi bacterium RBG_16_57_11]|nr:MAG: hypothetical protein A2W35_06535 [Chloroflexi bacterium RBG_16_57_11]